MFGHLWYFHAFDAAMKPGGGEGGGTYSALEPPAVLTLISRDFPLLIPRLIHPGYVAVLMSVLGLAL